MLTITVAGKELWDEKTESFITTNEQTLVMEHSLVSLSKWESKYKKPFLTKDAKTDEEMIDYFRFMTITNNVDPNVYYNLTNFQKKQIADYIGDKQTATTINQKNNHAPSREIITSELIYYWMVSLQIPFECQKWHLSRLLTLVNVCNIKNQPPKKRSAKDQLASNYRLNAARRAASGSRG